MEKKDIAAFFDNCAGWWDADMIRNEDIITKILDNAGILPGVSVLDVACGTGVLFPDYLDRQVASLTGIDISPEMVKVARSKFPAITVLCGDVEEVEFAEKFDAIMVYNAFPHFPEPGRLIEVLAGLVKPGGRLSIAHGMSRTQLQQHHAGRAAQVSIDLIHEKELAQLMEPWFEVNTIISDEQMYQVAGTRRAEKIDIQPRQAVTPLEEVLALMKFMIAHNDAHAQEMSELANQLKDMGKTRAYEKIMDAVTDFDIVNAKFDAILKELSTEE